jgi:DNA polymerase III delta subunit
MGVIYFFTGTDAGKARAKAFAWVEAARKKQPDAAYFRISPEALTASALDEAAGASGLFFNKSLVLVDDPFSLKDAGQTVLDHLGLLADSANPVAILAPKLPAAALKKIEAKAEKTFVADLAEKKPARGFNAALVNALGAKDGTALWREIAKAERAGDAPEMLHGLLHWKARDLMQKGSRSWTPREARTLSLDLIELLSDARAGSLDLGLALERWALSI